MLSRLSIRNIVLIERLDIDFTFGLSVLTGETGAGKSILLDALSLALGARGDASLVRYGTTQGQVIAVFDVPRNHPVRTLLADNAIKDDGDIILKRVQTADGRTRVFVNDRPSSVTLMRDIGRALVEIHGQHDDRALVDVGTHRDVLDSFGGHVNEVNATAEAWKLWRNAEQELLRHREKVKTTAREAEFLRSSVMELSKLDPQPGEESELSELRATMMCVESIASEIQDAQDLLSGSSSPLPQLASLLRRLQRKAAQMPGLLDEVIKSLDEAMISLDAAQAGVDVAMCATEYDPRRLEKAEERLFTLRAAARKYKVTVDDLVKLRDTMVADLANLDVDEGRLQELEQQEIVSRYAYDQIAANMSKLRKEAAEDLRKTVMAELPELKLEHAEFLIEMSSETDNRMQEGIDQVEFWVRTNPSTRPGPMMKVASGGELSRFMLALKVALADRSSAPTLVFDEIDTGVGGAVADAIGQRLALLSRRVQVLSVTHAPQVAARAATHFLIYKNGNTDKVDTGIHAIDHHARQEEIARMLSGATITEEARAAAERLLRENTTVIS